MIAKYARRFTALMLMLVLLVCLPAVSVAAKPDEQIQVRISSSSHPLLDGVIYLTEGDTVTIETTPSVSDPAATFVYFWMLGTKDADGKFVEEAMVCREKTYSFTASSDLHGKYLSYSVGNSDYRPGSFELKLNVVPRTTGSITLDVETSHPVANDVLTATEGETVTINTNPSCTLPDAQLHHFWIFEVHDENGEIIEEERQECMESIFSFTATEDLNGKFIYYSVGTGGAKPASFCYELKVLPKPKPVTLTVTPIGGSRPLMGDTKYLTEGETVPFRADASYEGSGVDLTYTWYIETRDASGKVTDRVKQDCADSTYNLTASMDQNQKYLTCYVEGPGLEPASYSLKLAVTYQIVGSITLDVKSSHPVADDVLTVVEGETVTISTNPTSPLADADYHHFWFLEVRDQNGQTIEEEKLPCEDGTYSFVAAKGMNGKYLYYSVGADRLKPGSFSYKLKVLSKVEDLEEEYAMDIEEGITSESLSEELKKNPALDTPAKVEADITIKVLAEAKASGVEISSEQTAVYDVTLLYSEDGGNTYEEATRENWPESGRLKVTLPYPAGTGRYTHTFVVAHMFTETTADHKAGDIEYPAVTNTASGIQFEVTGLSPIAVAWEEQSEVAAVPSTGDHATPYLWMLAMLMAGAGCVALVSRRRQNG